MRAPSGLSVKLVAAEPVVRQPVAIEFDDRGRLWVIQYLQYPNPAGLKRVDVDRYSRTKYDRVPAPPPRGPKGADRVTVLEGPDARGRFRKGKDFVSGLNLASGLAFGHDGVFILQVPYLLFYSDRNRDDVPDGDPEVLLTGFGMEDAHSVANSLTWGPDGWLYGCQGSTVTARIKNPARPRDPPIEFQQGVWRYHPPTRRFELFCEGGGNSWGLDFDRHGNLIYSTNYGGFVALHGVQGAYYWKAFGKHGPLHNPHAYGYIDHIPHRNPRSGHVTVGGIVYRGDSFPARFRDKYIAADLLGHNIYWHDLEPDGSSFRSGHGGELLASHDTWFAPCDVTAGPDGSVYVADWYDKRTAHPDPDADWDKSNGRIYKIEAEGTASYRGGDLRKLSTPRLIALLSHPNDWLVRKARRILADRRDQRAIAPLTVLLENKDDQLALEALWALYVSGGFTDALAGRLIDHRNPDIRRWTVRFLGDEEKVAPLLARRLIELAVREPDVTVRSQLACTAKRLPASVGLPIVHAILRRNLDGKDPHIPLLLWWAVEHHAVSAMPEIVKELASSEAWKSDLARTAILGRLVRRYASEGGREALNACASLLAAAPSLAERRGLLPALDEGLAEQLDAGGARPMVPTALERQLSKMWRDDTADVDLIRMMVRLDRQAAHRRALELATAPRGAIDARVSMITCLGAMGRPDCAAPLLNLVERAEPEAVRLAALAALQRFDRAEIGSRLIDLYPKLPVRLRARAADVLLSRPGWALAFLRAIDATRLSAKDISVEQLRPVAGRKDSRLNELVRKHWGNVAPATPEVKLAEIRRLNNDLRAAAGNPLRGRELFTRHCASCHRLFGVGEQLGPDLTHANRKDRDYLLVSIVDPSAVIRKEYLSYTVHTRDGRSLMGLIAEQSAGRVILVSAKNERTILPKAQIQSIEELAVSLMPENLLMELRPDEVRNLFAYLQSDLQPTK
jgi:putative membrane-bound dehydrogenase-like protein